MSGIPQRRPQPDGDEVAGLETGGSSLPVSVVLPVLNESQNLPKALESVQWASEIFVVDSGSTDDTRAIAESFGATVVQFDYEHGGPKKKAWSLRNLPFTNEWALYLDGDERITDALEAEISGILRSPEHDGYYLDREFIFRGKELQSYRPDWNLRLFRHKLAQIEDLGMQHLSGTGDNEIHEHFELDGSTGFLGHPLLHDDYRGIGPWIDRHNKYATWEAHVYRRLRSEPVSIKAALSKNPTIRNRLIRRIWVRLPGRPALRFVVWYFVKRAIFDGWRGLQYSLLMAWYEFVISVKLAELEGR
jgi:glycosyltransferase involved in cell wall biosynthesis